MRIEEREESRKSLSDESRRDLMRERRRMWARRDVEIGQHDDRQRPIDEVHDECTGGAAVLRDALSVNLLESPAEPVRWCGLGAVDESDGRPCGAPRGVRE